MWQPNVQRKSALGAPNRTRTSATPPATSPLHTAHCTSETDGFTLGFSTALVRRAASTHASKCHGISMATGTTTDVHPRENCNLLTLTHMGVFRYLGEAHPEGIVFTRISWVLV
eukprot:scaffold16944_cov60-Phaeocystis_antarctica.AAC.5